MSETIQFIQITPGELQDAIVQGVSRKLDEIKEHLEPKSPEEYLSKKEAAAFLKINISTLHSYIKKGVIPAYSLKGRVYVKRSEVEKAIIRLT
jgi:excisionase family DNA binding protein